jgi:hypothetical protein
MVALLTMPRSESRRQAERRLFPRKEIHTRVEGRRLDHTLTARRDPHVSLALRDLSLGGLSAPPQGAARGWDAYGRVIRCEPSGIGYRVAMEFDPLPAA